MDAPKAAADPFAYVDFEARVRGAQDRLKNCELDAGIAHIVIILNACAIETFESCEGGDHHAFPEPTVRFYGEASEGHRALAVALQHRFHPTQLNRYWRISDGEPHGPYWEMTFDGPTGWGANVRRWAQERAKDGV